MADLMSNPNRIGNEVLAEGPLVGAARTAEAVASRARERIAETKQELSKKSLGELVEGGRTWVRENPVQSVLVAVGIGALAGYLLGRRRS